MNAAIFTLTAQLSGTGRNWIIGNPGVFVSPGFLNAMNTSITQGGEADVPFGFSSSYMDDPAGTVLTVKNYDGDVVQPTVNTLTINSSGGAILPITGMNIGSGAIIVQDAMGDEQVINCTVLPPSVSSTINNVVQGGTYTSSNMPGFTFSIPVASVTPVVMSYNTSGSTLPSSLMGTMSSGTVTIPAGQTSVFVPFTVPDDGKIAPMRTVVVTLTAAAGGARATMNVQNNDVPTVTMNGLANNAVIPLDPQGDNTKLTDIKLDAGAPDGQIVSWTLTWYLGDFLIWPNKQTGTPGVNDLASVFSFGGFGPSYNPTNGTESFTGDGSPPTDIYGQCLQGSTNWDTTAVEFSVDVRESPTSDVPPCTTTATNDALGTANGPEVLYGGKPVNDVIAGQVVIGEGVTVQVIWVGPSPNASAGSSVNWTVRQAVTAYTRSDMAGTVTFLSLLTPEFAAAGSPLALHFYWYGPDSPGSPDRREVLIDGSIAGTIVNVQTFFDVWTPQSSLEGDATRLNPKVGVLDDGYGNIDGTDEPALSLGTYSNPGMSFNASATAPTFIGGTISVTQLVSGIVERSKPGQYQYAVTGGLVLDGDPHGRFGAYIWNDAFNDLNAGTSGSLTLSKGGAQVAPFDVPDLSVTDYTKLYRYFYAVTYLMWQPYGVNNVDSIAVPLRKFTWEFEVGATLTNNWKVTVVSAPPDKTASSPTAWFPQWTSFGSQPWVTK